MQNTERLKQLASAAATLKDIAQHTNTYNFHLPTPDPMTYYMRAENAIVQVARWSRPAVEVTALLNGAFGWRIATDQDDAGVYLVALRRMLIGRVSTAKFDVVVPQDTFVVLNLTNCDLRLTNVNNTVEIDPATDTALVVNYQ